MLTVSTSVAEFPRTLLPLLRCPEDAGQLSLRQELRSGAFGVIDAILRCEKCSQDYVIEEGIARLLTDSLTEEDRLEISLKDPEYKAQPEVYVAPAEFWRSEFADRFEIPPHLEGLEPLNGRRVLEFGCGDGRLTILMAQRGADVLAVDSSIEGLRKMAVYLARGVAPTTYRVAPLRPASELTQHVGLVHAHAGYFHAAPLSFDRVLSATPLDSRDERMRMYRTAADSLNDDGRYIAGVEYDDLNRRLFGLPLVRRYSPDGILIDHLDVAMMRREMAPYFSRLRFRPIRPHVPFIRQLPMKSRIFLARVVAALPVLRELGEILLVRAEGPIRRPVEGARRRGNFVAKSLYRWFKRMKGEKPQWDPSETV